MNKVDILKSEVQELNIDELAAFGKWFRVYDSTAWDRQIEEDTRTGKLDKVAEEALVEHRAGQTKEF